MIIQCTWHSITYGLWKKPNLHLSETRGAYYVSFSENNGTQEFWKVMKNLQIDRWAPYKK